MMDADLRQSVQSLLRAILVFRSASDRCQARVRWARNHGRPLTPIAVLDFDIIFSLFLRDQETLPPPLDVLGAPLRATFIRRLCDPSSPPPLFLPMGTAMEMEQYQRGIDSNSRDGLVALREKVSQQVSNATVGINDANHRLIERFLSEQARSVTGVNSDRGRPLRDHRDALNIGQAASLLRVPSAPLPALVSATRAVHEAIELQEQLGLPNATEYPLIGNIADLLFMQVGGTVSDPEGWVRMVTEVHRNLSSISEIVSSIAKNEDVRSLNGETITRVQSLWSEFIGLLTVDTAFQDTQPIITLHATIIELRGRTAHGALVESVSNTWRQILRELQRNPELLFEFTNHPRKFEEFIAGAYHEYGFDQVELTPRSGDLGRDIIATKSGYGSVRFLDQVKAYSPGRVVTAEEVRAMVGVLHLDHNASKALITTTADFAPGVQHEFARMMPHRLELKSGQQLRAWLMKLVSEEMTGKRNPWE
jgi:restriction system protein